MINKKIVAAICCIAILLTGCDFNITNKLEYEYNTSEKINMSINADMPTIKISSLANNYAVIPFDGYVYSDEEANYMACLLVNQTEKEVLQCANPHKRIYPASMTKIMTAMIVVDEINAGRLSLNETITLSKSITFDDPDATGCGLRAGDSITVKELLYALLIRSFNDCCVVLAERIAGSEDAFCDMMNQKALEIGATNTHYANSHGLHLANHYTTIYDLYLIFQEFSTYDMLSEIDGMRSYTMKFYRSSGELVEVECSPTNGFMGEYALPEGLTMHGWKTGTTSQAGNCLIMGVTDSDNKEYIAVVANAIDKSALYEEMTNMLTNITE